MAVQTINGPGGLLWSEGSCGVQSYTNEADGFINSPGYEYYGANSNQTQPHYANNLKCEYRIQVEPGTRILFVMVALSLQRATPVRIPMTPIVLLSNCLHDYVQIFNGDERLRLDEMYPVSYTLVSDDANGTIHREAQHGQMCGAATPGQLQLWSTSNVATVRFSTDGSVTSTGFLLRWTTVYPKIDNEFCGLRPNIRLLDNGASEINPQITKRITGGQDAQVNTWLFVCQIRVANGRRRETCGGTLIKNIEGEFYMITAAHCVDPPRRLINVACNLDRGRAWDSVHEPFDVDNVVIHPGFSYGSSNGSSNDIAILKLRRRNNLRGVLFKALTACLPNHRHNLIAHKINEHEFLDRAIALGWGLTSSSSNIPAETLQQVVVNILPKQYCKQIHDYYYRDHQHLQPSLRFEMCVYGRSGGRITNPICNGDSGAPLVTFRYDRDTSSTVDRQYIWTLTGLSARSAPPCGNIGMPSIYTDVFEYRGWINEQINGVL